MASQEHERWMARAVSLAARGKGRVEPNPPVGAVIVRDGRPLGEGYHQRFGGPHAEVNAMAAVAGGDCRGATMYVTLAPCTGLNKKTPPCADAVLRAGFACIVIGAEDPTQESALPRMKAAGMEVITGVLEESCARLIAPFLKLKQHGLPYVIAKWAMSADGKIATALGDSRWVSSEESRTLVHQWRDQVDAVLVGLETVIKDDPELTCRIPNGRNPLRIVLDSQARLPLTSRLVKSMDKAPLLVACVTGAPQEAVARLEQAGCRVLRLPPREGRVDVLALLRTLGQENLTNIIVEGGARVMAEFLQRGLVDEVRAFIAPKIVGGRQAPTPVSGDGVARMSEAMMLERVEWTPVGTDMLLTGVPTRKG